MLINEAAAQFCMRDNALLLRRVELFSLARQVARECAYTSTFKHHRSGMNLTVTFSFFKIYILMKWLHILLNTFGFYRYRYTDERMHTHVQLWKKLRDKITSFSGCTILGMCLSKINFF